ncbi:MAG: bifunctional folylpolyglutamate synthase/ dihydrofolate synthase [Desulfovibrio sp.]|nr:bifunctional folylpolyglutamate synthase/ dihydrofolate synthase [Desulfovibrio sp.]
MTAFASLPQFEDWLNKKGLFHMQLGLERMRQGLVPPVWPAIQVLGTNGKGSTSAFIAALARAHGLRAGLYTSPHFLSIKERILVDGRKLPDSLWLEAASELADLDAVVGFTWFEFMTRLAVLLFEQAGVDLAILEAGLGGRNDATSAIAAIARCFTPIAMDHAAVIGPRITDIARDKTAVIGASEQVFSASQFPEVQAALVAACAAKGARLEFVNPASHEGLLATAGRHQAGNAALALAAWRWFAAARGIVSDPQLERAALAGAFVPGRMQRIPATAAHPELVLDGGHNPHAVHNLLMRLPGAPATVIFSALHDKDWPVNISLLGRTGARLIIVQLRNSRAESAAKIAAFANELRPGSAIVVEDVRAALAQCAAAPALVCGSLYLLADFYALFPQYLEDARIESADRA